MIQKMCGLGLVGMMFFGGGTAQAEVISFEDVNLPSESYWNGDDGSGVLVSGSVSFLNAYNPEYGSWDGFAASTMNDATLKGWAAQYNAISGRGLLGSPTYGLCYRGFVSPPRIVLDEPAVVEGLYVTNNDYAYYSLREGDGYAKEFGGVDGNDPDWFKLTIVGHDGNDVPVGSVDVFLADFRFSDNSLDYILDAWLFVDLFSLGKVASLVFDFSSSDNDPVYGMKTPAYAAFDNVVLAESQPYTEPGIPGFDPMDEGRVHPIFRAWATDWVVYQPGQVSDDYADPGKALGSVTGNNIDIVSLGELDAEMIAANVDPGQITLVFGDPNDPNDSRHIHNGQGDDFVVFENSFVSAWTVEASGSVGGQLLAELAYVEVSTNGVDFVRFPSVSLVNQAVGPYGTLDTSLATNLAGLHPNAYGECLGTAFDLDILKHCPEVLDGAIDLQDIRFVRLVDIPGNGSYTDSTGHPIYDQWPTIGSGGFDLEAIGVLHAQVFSADINVDGMVDGLDQALLEQNLGLSFGQNIWLSRTDLNGDWKTDQADMTLLTDQMGSIEAWRTDESQ